MKPLVGRVGVLPLGCLALMPAMAEQGVHFATARLTTEGNLHYADGRLDEALASYTRAQASNPSLPALRYNIGAVLYRKGNLDGAMEELEAALSGAGLALLGRAAYNLGNAQFRSGRFREAVASYRKALLADPRDEEAKRNLELALRRLRERAGSRPRARSEENRAESARPAALEERAGRGDAPSPSQAPDAGAEGEPPPREKADRSLREGRQEGGHSREGGEDRGEPVPQPGRRLSGEVTFDPGQPRRRGARFSQEQAVRILQALSEDELSALRRLRGRRQSSTPTRKDW
jgi:tetratricopeptide (TPR) repeat protein